MRGQSLGLVTAADKIPAIGVLFAVDYDVIVRKPCFQRGTTHVFLKNFRSFLFKFFGQRHGVLILLQPIRIGPCSGGRSIFRSIPGIFFLFVLKARITRMRRKSQVCVLSVGMCCWWWWRHMHQAPKACGVTKHN